MLLPPFTLLKRGLLFLLLCALASCSAHYSLVKANRTEYPINHNLAEDSAMIRAYQPYKKQMDVQMNRLIGQCARELTKSYDLPETLLGNFFSDAVLAEGKKLDTTIDFSMSTTKGGLCNNLPKGELHLYDLFELMPFENEMVTLRLRGTDVESLLTFIAAAGGEPVSGLRMTISNGKPRDVVINGQAFDPNKTYTVLVSDYIAGGGDNSKGLANPIEKKVLGLKIRDALISYVKTQTASGKIIDAQLDGRITKN
jgi:2',3'-cyclic-nucleotide 2'-phosphodiesterase (5'-nucleotidase family)